MGECHHGLLPTGTSTETGHINSGVFMTGVKFMSHWCIRLDDPTCRV